MVTKAPAHEPMVATLSLGVALFVLLIGPFVTYALLAMDGGGSRSRQDRESTVPSSATTNYPSRTVPGGNKNKGD